MDSEKDSLGKKLKALRKPTGKKQEDVARAIGISRARYSHYENDRVEPDIELIRKMASYFDVSIDTLLGREERKSGDNSANAEFEKWLNDPRIGKFFKELADSPEEQREQLFAMWKIINKNQDKDS